MTPQETINHLERINTSLKVKNEKLYQEVLDLRGELSKLDGSLKSEVSLKRFNEVSLLSSDLQEENKDLKDTIVNLQAVIRSRDFYKSQGHTLDISDFVY